MKIVMISLFLFLEVMAQAIDPNNLTPVQATQIQETIKEVQAAQPGNQFAIPQAPTPGKPAPPKAGPFTQASAGPNNSRDLEKKVAARIKDPFMLPNHLYLKIKRKLGDVQGEGYVDESMPPQKRWALKRYKLVAIIWNVKNPKAMINDSQGALHMFQVSDRIGNSEGIITSISNGEVVVNEKGNETKLRMSK